MTKAAQLGRGTFTYIGDVSQVESRMASLIHKLESPLVKDVSVRWPQGEKLEMFPNHIPDVYAGEPVLFAVAADELRGSVTLAGQFGTQPWSRTLTFDTAESQAGVSVLWAKSKVAALLDQHRQTQDPSLRMLVIELAMTHRLVTPFTSFVAVDVTPSRAGDQPSKTAQVPTRTPEGQLPRTATPAHWQLLLGLLLLAMAGVLFRHGSRPNTHQPRP
jgi:Ca-activated chloride channel family protein